MMTSIRRPNLWTAVVAICAGVAAISMTIGAVRAAPHDSLGGGATRGVTVILHCVYFTPGPSTPFRTEVRGIEVSGQADPRLETGGPCSDAISRLASLGLSIVNSTSASADYSGDGVVDAADYVVWRKSF